MIDVASNVGRMMTELVGSSRKERKTRIVRLLHLLKRPSTSISLHELSVKKLVDPKLKAYTWNQLLADALTVLGEEMHANSRFAKTSSSTIAPFFKLVHLILVQSCGQESSVLDVNTLLDTALTTLTDPMTHEFHQPTLTSLRLFLRHCRPDYLIVDSNHYRDLIKWLCKQLTSTEKSVVSTDYAYLLNLTIRQACSLTDLPLEDVLDSLICFVLNLDQSVDYSPANKSTTALNVGWAMRCLHWILVNVFPSRSVWLDIQSRLLPAVDQLIHFLTSMMSVAAPAIQTKDNGPDNLISQTSDCKQDAESLLPLLTTDRVSDMNPPLSIADIVWQDFNSISRQFSTSQDLINPSLFFRVQLSFCQGIFSPKSSAPDASELIVVDELLFFWRWWLLTVGRRPSCGDWGRVLRKLLSFCLHQFTRLIGRMGFQSPASIRRQLRASQGQFALNGLVLAMCWHPDDDYDSTDENNNSTLLEYLIGELENWSTTPSEGQQAAKRAKLDNRQKNDGPNAFFTSLASLLVSNDESDCGYLWWLVIDWFIRFQFQTEINHFTANDNRRSSPIVPVLLQLLTSLMPCLKSVKTPLAYECALGALHSGLIVVNFAINSDNNGSSPTRSNMVELRAAVDSVLMPCWHFVVNASEVLLAWRRNTFKRSKRDLTYSKIQLSIVDRLICKLLVLVADLLVVLFKSSPTLSPHSISPLLTSQIVRLANHFIVTFLLSPSASTSDSLSSSSWSCDLLVALDRLLQTCFAPTPAFDPSINKDWPTTLMHSTSCILPFLVSSFASLSLETDACQLDYDSTLMSKQCCWLTSALCSLIESRIDDSNMLSSMQRRQLVSFLRQRLRQHPAINSVDSFHCSISSIRMLTALVQSDLGLARLINDVSDCSTMAGQVLRLFWTLYSSKLLVASKRSNGDHEVDNNTDEPIDIILHELLSAIVTLLDTAFANQHSNWLPPPMRQQLARYCFESRPSLQAIHQLDSSSSILTSASSAMNCTRFGDDEFDLCNASMSIADDDQSIDQLFSDSSTDSTSLWSPDRSFPRLGLLSHLVKFAVATDCEHLFDIVQQELGRVDQQPCLHLIDVQWLTSLINCINKALMSSNVSGSSLALSRLISRLVDTIRESIKAALLVGKRCPNWTSIVLLARSCCQLGNLVVRLMTDTKTTESNQQWIRIGSHLDLLASNVWKIMSDRGSLLVYGPNCVASHYLRTWFKLSSTGIIDASTATLTHCLNAFDSYPSLPNQLLFTTVIENQSIETTSASVACWRSFIAVIVKLIDASPTPHWLPLLITLTGKMLSGAVCNQQLLVPTAEQSSCRRRLLSKPIGCQCLIDLLTCLMVKYSTVDQVSNSTVLAEAFRTWFGTDQCPLFDRQELTYLASMTAFQWLISNQQRLDDMLTLFPWHLWPAMDRGTMLNSIMANMLGLYNLDYKHSSEVECFYASISNSELKDFNNELPMVIAYLLLSCGDEAQLNQRWLTLCEKCGLDPKFAAFALLEPCTFVQLIDHLLRLTYLLYPTIDSSCQSNGDSSSQPYFSRLLSYIDRLCCLLNSGPDRKKSAGIATDGDVLHRFSQTLVVNGIGISDLVDQLLILACSFVSPTTTKSSTNSMSLFSRHQRLTFWTDTCSLIANITCSSLLDKTNSTVIGLADYIFWRLLTGHLELIHERLELMDRQLEASNRSHQATCTVFDHSALELVELLQSLSMLIECNMRHSNIDRDVEMESVLYHALLSHLLAIASSYASTPIVVDHTHDIALHGDVASESMDNLKSLLLNEVQSLLLMLVQPETKLVKIMCLLPEIPARPTISLLSPTIQFHLPSDNVDDFHQHFTTNLQVACSCRRDDIIEYLQLLNAYFHPNRLLRCRQFARYQYWVLQGLVARLAILLDITKPAGREGDDQVWTNQLEPPQGLVKLIARLTDAEHHVFFTQTNLLSNRLNRLKPSDTASQCSLLTSLDLLNHVVRFWQVATFDPLLSGVILTTLCHAPHKDVAVTSDALVDSKWQVLVEVGRMASKPNSEACIAAHRVLDAIFECQSSLDQFQPLLTNQSCMTGSSLSTILHRHLSRVDFKRLRAGKSCSGSAINLTAFSDSLLSDHHLSPPILSVKESDNPSEAFDAWLEQFTTWLIDLPNAVDPVLARTRPLLSLSPVFCRRLLPSLIADLFLATVSSSTSSCSKPIRSLLKRISQSLVPLEQPSDNDGDASCQSRKLIWLDTMLLVHRQLQWMRVNGSPSAQLDVNCTPNWLTLSSCATSVDRPRDSRLFLELAWLHDNSPDDWLASHSLNRRIWLDSCRQLGDSFGLEAAKIAFLSSPVDDTNHDDIGCKLVGKAPTPVSTATLAQTNSSWSNALFRGQLKAGRTDLTGLNDLQVNSLRHLGNWTSPTANRSSSIDNTDGSLVATARNRPLDDDCLFWLSDAFNRSDWQLVGSIAVKQCRRIIADCFDLDNSSFNCSNQLHHNQLLNCLLPLVNQPLLSLSPDPSHTSQLVLSQLTLAMMQLDTRPINRLTDLFALIGQYSSKYSPIGTGHLCLTVGSQLCSSGASGTSSGRESSAFLQMAQSCKQMTKSPSSFVLDWLDLRSSLLQSSIDCQAGDWRLASTRLEACLASVKQRLSNLKVDSTSVKLDRHLQGLLTCYLTSVSILSNWLFESHVESAGDLIANFINPSIEMANKWSVGGQVNAEAYASLAKLADSQFTALNSYLASAEFASRKRFLADAQRDVLFLTDMKEKRYNFHYPFRPTHTHISRCIRLLQRQSAVDGEELESIQPNADRFLELAIDAYLQCLALSDSHNLKIYRLVSLWFLASVSDSLSTDSVDSITAPNQRSVAINRLLASKLPTIRPDKFLPLAPQLVARLSTTNQSPSSSNWSVSFQANLVKLVERIIDWHPHHTAFTLLCVVNANLDDQFDPHKERQHSVGTGNASRKRPTMTLDSSTLSTLSSRSQAAGQIYSRLLRQQGRHAKLLGQMQTLAEACVEWANADVERHRGSSASIAFPSHCKMKQLVVANSRTTTSAPSRSHHVDLVAVPTLTPIIDRSGSYSNNNNFGLIRMVGYANSFRLAGGINLPKIVNCLGSDGRLYKQLIKGKDDPRQDAVMQQVFTAANCLIARHNPHFQSRSNLSSRKQSTSQVNNLFNNSSFQSGQGLYMRTYKVVPMAQRSGMIEWCEGTVPLGEWLAGERGGGAHSRYRPSDMTPSQAKQRLASVRDRPIERRRAVFDEVCSRLKPVMAYFFLEQFPTPEAWHRARLSYTRSLAVSSLVGYLVGLGDRHPHNLLLHQSTGELVHIDLGVAFDQGRLLPTPEMVPFRLTRDLVHGLGPMGLEAGLIPVAEAVLGELCVDGDVIVTLLQVLLYDPLYTWSLTPAQLCALEARRAEMAGETPPPNTNATPRASLRKTPVSSSITAASIGGAGGSMASSTAFGDQSDAVAIKSQRNKLAERVLLGVRSKLEGRPTSIGGCSSMGSSHQLDSAGHVALLIRQAVDPANLASMYFGWQAYL